MLSANSSRALAPIVSMEVMSVGSLFLVLAAVPCGRTTHVVNRLCRCAGSRQEPHLQRAVKLGLVHLEVPQDREDGEDGRVVVPHDGPARR